MTGRRSNSHCVQITLCVSQIAMLFIYASRILYLNLCRRYIQNSTTLDTTYRIVQRYRIKFGTEKSKVLHIGPPSPLQNKFTLGPQTLEATDTYKYLGITLNTKGDLTDHLKITKGKTLTNYNQWCSGSGATGAIAPVPFFQGGAPLQFLFLLFHVNFAYILQKLSFDFNYFW